ncbi:hypothetical protein ABK040_003243 [Willaertia magna]
MKSLHRIFKIKSLLSNKIFSSCYSPFLHSKTSFHTQLTLRNTEKHEKTIQELNIPFQAPSFSHSDILHQHKPRDLLEGTEHLLKSNDLSLPKTHFTSYNIARNISLPAFEIMLTQNHIDYQLLDKTKSSLVIKLLKREEGSEHVVAMLPQFVVVYSFGTICFINCEETLHNNWINLYSNFIKLPENKNWLLSSDGIQLEQKLFTNILKDDFQVLIDNKLNDWCEDINENERYPNSLIIKMLDLNNLNIISGVLSRSITLKTFENQVHEILMKFQKLNFEIINYKKFSSQNKHELLPVIALGNELKCELLLNVKLLEKPEVTWSYPHYDVLYDSLYKEFEINQRMQTMESKLSFIQENTGFFLELAHSLKSERAEILIILLISTEIILSFLH